MAVNEHEVGQKQKTEKKKEKRRAKVGNNNGQQRIATPPRVAHAKPPVPKKTDFRELFRNGQHSVTEPRPTPSPWSILHNLCIKCLDCCE